MTRTAEAVRDVEAFAADLAAAFRELAAAFAEASRILQRLTAALPDQSVDPLPYNGPMWGEAEIRHRMAEVRRRP